MLRASLPHFIKIAILLAYVAFAHDKHGWPRTFVVLAWLPFLGNVALHHFFDGVQNTTRNIARIYLLHRYGVHYVRHEVPRIQEALIPDSLLPLLILWLLLDVASFLTLLWFQGWATALLAEAVLWTPVWALLPIRYLGHLRRIQRHIAVKLSVYDPKSLPDEMTDLLDLVDEAIEYKKDPQEWWGESLRNAQHLAHRSSDM